MARHHDRHTTAAMVSGSLLGAAYGALAGWRRLRHAVQRGAAKDAPASHELGPKGADESAAAAAGAARSGADSRAGSEQDSEEVLVELVGAAGGGGVKKAAAADAAAVTATAGAAAVAAAAAAAAAQAAAATQDPAAAASAAAPGAAKATEPEPGSLPALFADLARSFAAARAAQGGRPVDASTFSDKRAFGALDAQVRALLQGYLAGGAPDAARYSYFNGTHYVRNLVDSNEDFELMLVCWLPGQVSRVHDHQKSNGWMLTIQGEVVERMYAPPPQPGAAPAPGSRPTSPAAPPAIPGVLAATSPCPELVFLGESKVRPGDVAYINDARGLHSVGCAAPSGGGSGSAGAAAAAQAAVTVHVYAPPITRVTLYEPEADRVVRRVPGFYSVKGRRTPNRE